MIVEMNTTDSPADLDALVGHTPLHRLTRLPGRPDVTVLAKLEGNNAGGSVKDRAALSMIRAALTEGRLEGRRLVEATSGNTGIALAMIAALERLPITLVMPENSTPERVAIMKAYGAEVVLTPAKGSMEAAIDHARALVETGRYHMLDQFSNPANPEAHYRTTGPEIWTLTGGRVTHFVSAMGTTGTIMGVSRFLKSQRPDVTICGVQPSDEARIPGIRRWPAAYLPRIYDPARVDRLIDCTEAAAVETTQRLAREEGLFVGMSAGGAAWAALSVAREAPAGSVVVFIAPDRGDKYLSMESLFPR
jgi:cysteine synthase B